MTRTARPTTIGGAETLRLALAVLVLLSTSCGVDVRDGFGPHVLEPDVEGMVLRGATPAIRADVELHNVASGMKVFETRTNRYGSFAFFEVPSGLWEVRVESDQPGDFASVRRQFYRADGDGRFAAGRLDISNRGVILMEPSDEAVTVPTPFDPLDFRWTSTGIPGAVAQVQVYDDSSRNVWRSSLGVSDSARWYGYGSEGSYQNVPVGAGKYEWRVKFEFPDTTEARTERRRLRLE